MEQVGLEARFADRYPAQLSGGQQQRVGVARALAADPPVMLMDEPFSAVDPVVREQLQQEFLRLQQELGKTIVFVTHDIDEAIKLGDQVAVLAVGGMLAQLASPRSCCPPAPTPSSPGSSAATAATARSVSSRATCRWTSGRRRARRAVAEAAGCPGRLGAGRRRRQPPAGLAGVGHGDRGRGRVTDDLLNFGGTLAPEGGTLRGAWMPHCPHRPARRRRRRRRSGWPARVRGPTWSPGSRPAAAAAAPAAAGGAPLMLSYFTDHADVILALLWAHTWLSRGASGHRAGHRVAPRVAGHPLPVDLPAGDRHRSGCSTRSRRWCCSSLLPGILGTQILDVDQRRRWR